MTENFTPLLTTHDWNEEWKQLQKARRNADDAAYWDKRSATFATKDAPSPYVERFLALAGIRPGESVFDMGCGTGALTLPLARKGHDVVAADFSQGMLDRLREGLAEDAGAESGADGGAAAGPGAEGRVRTVYMSWEDDWGAHGVGPASCDVAVASRSIATADLRASLLKLGAAARRRVCITLTTGSSPRTDERVLEAIGIQRDLGRDYLYAFNILASEGIKPEVAYIESTRADTFDSPEQAFDEYAHMVDASGALLPAAERDAALGRLRAWLADNLVPNEHAGEPDRKGVPERRLRLREPRKVTWAFIAWNK